MRTGTKGSSGPLAPGVVSTAPRGTVAVAYGLSATGILATSLVLPVLPDIARDLHVSTGRVGLVVALASLPGIVAAPLIGLFADRWGRRVVAVPCLLVFGVGGMASALAPTFGMLLLLRFVQGIGAAGLINLAVVILGDHFDGPQRARMIGRNAVVLTLGLSIYPTVGGALGQQWGWRWVFATYAVALPFALVAYVTLPQARPVPTGTLMDQVRDARDCLRDRRVVAMSAAGFAVFILVFGVATTLPLHLDEEFNAGALVRGVMLGLPAMGAAVVALLMGRLVARWGAWDLLPVGCALIAVAYLGIPASPVVLVVALPALAYGLGEGLTIVPLQDYAASLSPEQRGVMVAIWVSAVRGGQAVGPAVAGLAIGGLGTSGAFLAGAVFAGGLALATTAARPALKLADVDAR